MDNENDMTTRAQAKGLRLGFWGFRGSKLLDDVA